MSIIIVKVQLYSLQMQEEMWMKSNSGSAPEINDILFRIVRHYSAAMKMHKKLHSNFHNRSSGWSCKSQKKQLKDTIY